MKSCQNEFKNDRLPRDLGQPEVMARTPIESAGKKRGQLHSELCYPSADIETGRCRMNRGSLTPCPLDWSFRVEQDSSQADASRWKADQRAAWGLLKRCRRELHLNQPGLIPPRKTTPRSQLPLLPDQ